MNALVLGASGATGHLLVEQLLARGYRVKVIIRHTSTLPDRLMHHPKVEVVRGEVLTFTDDQLKKALLDQQVVLSCLGHNLSFKGLFGAPRYLVTDVTRRICQAISNNSLTCPVKFILMSSSGVRNTQNGEPVSFAHKIVITLLRLLIPPHRDNEKATHYLQKKIGNTNPFVEWVAVRPDSLINEYSPSHYHIEPKPTRDALFNAGKVSRINVAHFMAALADDTKLWGRWRFQTPVIYGGEY